VVADLLFLPIFAVVMVRHGRPESNGEMPYLAVLAPGLTMMAMAQNAFANSSSSLLIAKVQGNIADLLVAPLSPGEFVAGFALGAMTRGLVVGAVVALAMSPFVPFDLVHPSFVVFHALAATLLLALLGFVGGLWAQKMDRLGVMTSFVITPLTFLSGTFYSVADLPDPFRLAASLNPFFYMIDGFRYGVTGHADGDPTIGLAVMGGANLVLAVVCYSAAGNGWRLKS